MEWKWKIATVGAVTVLAAGLLTLYVSSTTEEVQTKTCVVTHVVAYKDEASLACAGGSTPTWKAEARQEDNVMPGETVQVWKSWNGWTTTPYEKESRHYSPAGGVAATLAMLIAIAMGLWAARLSVKSHH